MWWWPIRRWLILHLQWRIIVHRHWLWLVHSLGLVLLVGRLLLVRRIRGLVRLRGELLGSHLLRLLLTSPRWLFIHLASILRDSAESTHFFFDSRLFSCSNLLLQLLGESLLLSLFLCSRIAVTGLRRLSIAADDVMLVIPVT